MRKIKFRAWNKREKRWLYEFDFAVCGDGMVYLYTQGISEDGFFRLTEDLEITQYTGVKDKTDKEIYEGDIIKAQLPAYSTSDRHTIEEVIISETTIIGIVKIRRSGGVGILVKKILNDEAMIKKGHFLRIKKNDEIIGNIFENQELVTK